MKNLLVIISSLLLLTAVSCKSHKTTVIRASGPGVRVENSVKLPSEKTSDPTFSNNQKIGENLVKAARTWIGTPYRYGGQSKSGTDCSGMMMVIYKDVADLALPRTAAQQAEYCFDISRRDLQPGDLVFFSTSTRGGKVSHVGMYVGGDKMIHASTSRGVIESGLEEKYYKTHYHSSGRVYGITYAATGGKEQKPLRDTVLVAEHVVCRAVSELDSASALADSVKTKVTPDTVTEIRSVPELPTANINGPMVIVNGKRVPVTPVEQKSVMKTDTVVPDSVRQVQEIHETVVKAMKFGK